MEGERSVSLHSDRTALSFQGQGYSQAHSAGSFACLLGISTVYLPSQMINILRRDSLPNPDVNKGSMNCDTAEEKQYLPREGEKGKKKFLTAVDCDGTGSR